MFDSNFNIISGDRGVGRSEFLFQIGLYLRDNGLKTIFYGATDQYNFSNIKTPFDLTFFYRHNDDRVTKNIKEISDKNLYDYIFIDDIDFISQNHIDILSETKAKKICTCLIGKIPNNISKFKLYKMYRDVNFTNKGYSSDILIEIDDVKIRTQDFFKIFDRNQKINSIIKNEK